MSLSKKIISVILCLAMLLSSVCVAFAVQKNDEPEEMLIASISDIHYFPASLSTFKGDAFESYLRGANCNYDDLDAIIDAAFAALKRDVKEKGLKYLLVTGDLTTNGEYEGHVALAEKFHKLQEETGLKIFVTNGNHDINNSLASQFITEDYKKTPARITKPQEFYEIYRDFGFDIADDKYCDYTSGKAGALSYAVSLGNGYRLVVIDGGKYSKDNTAKGKDEHETGGNITDELLEWVLEQGRKAKKNGETVIAATHWNLSEMSYLHGELLQGFVIDNAYKLQEIFADNGINFIYSGHQHVTDADITYSDDGEPLYSIITPTLTQFPYQFRETVFTKNGKEVSAELKELSVDDAAAVEGKDGPYAKPYYITTGFAGQHAGLKSEDYFLFMIKNLLGGYIDSIQKSGSVVAFIKEQFGFDIKDFLAKYIKDGIVFGDFKLFTMDNAMSFINNLDKQIIDKFISNPDVLWALVRKALTGLVHEKASEVPCTKFIDSYGFGDESRGGTIEDLFFSCIAYMYAGNENSSDDKFIQDIISRCGKPEFVDFFFGIVKKHVVDEFLVDGILSQLTVQLDSLFAGNYKEVAGFIQVMYACIAALVASGAFQKGAFESIGSFTKVLEKLIANFPTSMTSSSYKTLLNAVLGTGLISYGSDVDELVDNILAMFFGDPQKRATAYQLEVLLSGIVSDEDSDFEDDENKCTYIYNGPVKVEPTEEDMQLPTFITMTGDDESSLKLRWFTKYSVTATDFEIVEKSKSFTGINTTGYGIEKSTSADTLRGYGFDFGTFGLFPYDRDTVRHDISLSGLKKGTAYKYRIGDFKKGFVYEGAFTTGSDDFTFLYLTDAAGTAPYMYEQNTLALNSAFKEFSNASFIINGGDSVYKDDNDDQWGWALNSSPVYRSLPVMYVSGDKDVGTVEAVKKHFVLPEAPAYSVSDYGAYYSFDRSNVHFIVINTNEANEDGSLSDQQTKFIEADLKKNDKDFTVLVSHKSLFGSSDNSVLRKQLNTLFSGADIDLILSGDDLLYARTGVVKNNRKDSDADIIIRELGGRTYQLYVNHTGLVSLTGGKTGFYSGELTDTNKGFLEKTKIDTRPVFTAVTVEGREMGVLVYAVNSDGSVEKIDNFGISKNSTRILVGDVNFDGDITVDDARLALRAAVKLETLSEKQILAGDTDRKDGVTVDDAREILRVAVKLQQFDPQYINAG